MSIDDFPAMPFPDVNTIRLDGVNVRTVEPIVENGRCELCRKERTTVHLNIGNYLHHLCRGCFDRMVKTLLDYQKDRDNGKEA